ncbi:MAG: hypothetical protein SGI74_07585 [Oligoflexia bacterium]|nr:hypothetical protein [Oligoflexia bacterium]
MDEDLNSKTKDELILEVTRLRDGIREHRNSSGHNLCGHHPKLWSLLPEKMAPSIEVPEWPQFLSGCIKYRQSLDEQLQGAPRTEKEFDRKS